MLVVPIPACEKQSAAICAAYPDAISLKNSPELRVIFFGAGTTLGTSFTRKHQPFLNPAYALYLMNNIVVLDGHSLNPGDLSWNAVERFGSCRVYARTPADEIVLRSKDADILLTNKTPLTEATLEQLPKLRYIGVLATGFNIVDVSTARRRGVSVANIPGYGTQSVAQHTWALILELTQQTGRHAQAVRDGRWEKNPDWCFWDYPLIELHGLTLGIVGSGRIGREVGAIGKAFGMRVVYATRAGGKQELERLLTGSDVISLHCPLTSETKEVINAQTIASMKPSAFLINTSRGGLVHEAELAHALDKGRIAGAALDVLSGEPPAPNNPLLRAKNCYVTPHLAWATTAARERLMKIAAENIAAFLAGNPKNVVNA